MELDLFKRCLKNIPEDYYIVFSGFCEPWLNPDCLKMILHASKNNFRVSVFTTLLGVKEEDIEILQNIQLHTFWVHLPSNDKLENLTVDHKYISVLNKLISSKIPASYHIHGKSLHDKIILPDNILVINEGICDRAGTTNLKACFPNQPQNNNLGSISCIRGMHQNVLLPNGDVALCCMDYELKHILGNLADSKLKSLYSSREYRTVLKGLSNKSVDIICRKCNFASGSSLNRRIMSMIGISH